MSALVGAILLALALVQAAPVVAQSLSPADMVDYLAQGVCLDGAGQTLAILPVDTACRRWRPQSADEPSIYRKHDWPNSLATSATALGYQASDAVVKRQGRRTLLVHTFDFGDAPRTFGRFDAGRGDGGQVAVLVGDWASFAMTEDGTGGVQWFVGENCRSRDIRKFMSWAIFRHDVARQGWNSILARLNITRRPDLCPTQYHDAFTRFRGDQLAFPFRIADGAGWFGVRAHMLDVVVSEHYGGSDIRTADHLERFFLARKLGLVRWERWSNGAVSREPGARDSAAMLARTERCPRLGDSSAPSGYGAPGSAWFLVDCRTWTTLVMQRQRWSVDDYNWPALGQFPELD